MFDFLYIFFLDAKKKHIAIKHSGFWSKNLLNYKNYKTMAQLAVLISALSGITRTKLLLINERFTPETFFSKWCLIVAAILPLAFFLF